MQSLTNSHPILSHYQATDLLRARADGARQITTSLDLNQTQQPVTVAPDGVLLPTDLSSDLDPNCRVAWTIVEKVAQNDAACYQIICGESGGEGELEKIQRFSEEYNRLYSLMPTTGAPTMLISGIPMHRIKGTEPQRDTQSKIRAARPFAFEAKAPQLKNSAPPPLVLDTATGLGYTAIAAARLAEQNGLPLAARVITIELDPTALEVCRLNPWSQELFDNPRIEQRLGDSGDIVPTFDNATFTQIIHDPPMLGLAGHLYSTDFYRELHRVLKQRGRLFHYIGDPESKSGKSTTRGVLQRLEQAGFQRIRRAPQAFGVTAQK